MNSAEFKPDIFTLWQRVPNVEPQHQYHTEWESIAALPVQSYDHWFNKQISSRLRSQLRKATKEGLTVREAAQRQVEVRVGQVPFRVK